MTATLPSFYRLVRHERIGSTSDEAKTLAAGGADEGTLIWALAQSSGHGRQGRRWVSPPGNLYLSLILRPKVSLAIAARLGFVAALAVADACARFTPDAALALKWPNDVLLGRRKLAGILLESQAAPGGALQWLVLGIGINLATYPVGVDYPATALSATGTEVAPGAMLAALAQTWLARYEQWAEGRGFAAIRADWLQRAAGLGQPLRARYGETVLNGRFSGLDADGALLLETADGPRRIAAGEVFPALA